MKHVVAVGALMGAVLAATPTMASAGQGTPATLERGHFVEHLVIDHDEFCGDLEVQLVVDDRGTYATRIGGSDHLPRFTSTHHGGATWTNVETGKAFTAWWNYSNRDVHVTDNGDGTLTIVYQVPGPERIYGPDGEQLNIDTGMMRLAATVAHSGTPQDPRDDVFLGEEFLVGHGFPPQPPFDFCESFRTLTAADA